MDAVKKYEKAMDKHTKELAQIENQLADEGLYTDPQRKQSCKTPSNARANAKTNWKKPKCTGWTAKSS